MSKLGPSRVSRARKAVALLSDLVSTLPTQAERVQIDSSLQTLISYLEEVRKSLSSVPTQNDLSDALATATKLDELLSRAESNPVLAKSLGLERTPRKKASSPSSAPASHETSALMRRVAQLTPDQARELLMDQDQCALADLKALARAYGIHIQSRWSREAIATKIVAHLANTRGYRMLAK